MLSQNPKVIPWQVTVIIALTVLSTVSVIWSFDGKWPGNTPEYNTYSLQAQAWLDGRVDIDNQKHLELAVYKEKFYVSFPPLPSVIMTPFVMIFGVDTPNAWINLLFVILGIFYAYRLARNVSHDHLLSLFFAFFVTIGSNYLFLMQNGWVWFFAQTLGFAFTMMALYYATTGKASDFLLAFLFLAFAIGCRPFQMVYGILILFLLWHSRVDFKAMLLYMLPAMLVGMLYAGYNYIRFESIVEFGHNYLPEMLRSQHGQFSVEYLSKNLHSLITIPPVGDKGALLYPHFNGFSIFLLNPIVLMIALLGLFFIGITLKKRRLFKDILVAKMGIILILVTLHILFICMHITMGGWHFGNRYFVDTLPALFLLFLLLDGRIQSLRLFYIPLFAVGFLLNAIGTTLFYLK